jgi:ferredoxin
MPFVLLTSQMIKTAALEAGADLCGIGALDRFEGAPRDMDPRYLFPDAKSVIGLAFRIPRGVQRGIEEGTQFFQYPSLAYGGINEIYGPAVLYRLGCFIEDHGYEAMVYRNTGARGVVSDMDGTAGNTLSPEEQISVNEHAKTKAAHHRTVQYTRPVKPDTVAPDLQFHFRLAAVACGLGEMGWSNLLLTPQFGPLQRVVFIFTDAPLEPDPLYSGPPLCLRCMACVRECPGNCLSRDEKISIPIGGKVCEMGQLNAWRCYAFYTHSGPEHDPFVPEEVFKENKNGDLDLLLGKAQANEQEILKVYGALEKYFPPWVGYNTAKCGGCIGACVSMLEKRGCLKDRFHTPLRSHKKWKFDVSFKDKTENHANQ